MFETSVLLLKMFSLRQAYIGTRLGRRVVGARKDHNPEKTTSEG